MVGSFNVRGTCSDLSEGSSVKGTVSPSDVHAFNDVKPRTHKSKEGSTTTPRGIGHGEAPLEEVYAVYLHCCEEVRVLALHQAIEIDVPPLCYELATFSRVVELARPQRSGVLTTDEKKEPVRWAPLGLPDMFNSCGAVAKQELIFPEGKGVVREEAVPSAEGGAASGVVVSVKGSGKFFAVASRRPKRATLCTEIVGADPCTPADGGHGSKVTGREAGVAGSDAVGVLEVSFSDLPEVCASEGGRGLGLVEVCIPGPWDGRERWLSFWWD